MPTCTQCGAMQATVEMRKSPKKESNGTPLWLCKNKAQCKQRRIAERANRIALQKGKS